MFITSRRACGVHTSPGRPRVAGRPSGRAGLVLCSRDAPRASVVTAGGRAAPRQTRGLSPKAPRRTRETCEDPV